MSRSNSGSPSGPNTNGFAAYRFETGELLVLAQGDIYALLSRGWFQLQGRVADELHRTIAEGEPLQSGALLRRLPVPQAEELCRLIDRGRAIPLQKNLSAERHTLLFLELTERCNLICSHCYAHSGPTEGELMPVETARRLLAEAASLGFERVQFTGGEPLLWPGIERLVVEGFDLGIPQIEIFTNGNLLTSALLDQLPERTSFALSFYSSDLGVHDGITGVVGSAQATLDAIDLLVSRGFDLRVGTVLMESNADHFESTRRFLIDRGVPAERVRATAMSAVGRGDYRPLPQDAATCDEDANDQGDVAQWQGKAAVSPTGDVYPCIFARDARLGSVHNRALRDILEAPQIEPRSDLSVPELWEFCAKRLSCPDCRTMVFNLLGQGE